MLASCITTTMILHYKLNNNVGQFHWPEQLSLDLTVFNADLSPERYWRGPRSQEAGGGGKKDY